MFSQTQTVTLTYHSIRTNNQKEGDAYVSKRKRKYNVAKPSKEGKMKTIEEMIATYTKEEWQKIIRSEMNELGLCFSEDTEYQGGNALW